MARLFRLLQLSQILLCSHTRLVGLFHSLKISLNEISASTGSCALLEKIILIQLVKNCAPFMEIQGSFREPDESTPRAHTLIS